MNIYFSAILLVFLATCTAKEKPDSNNGPIKYSYELNLNDFENDQLKVNLQVQAMDQDSATFCFPKIVPGIYGTMDFGQYISSFTAMDADKETLEVKKVGTNCWKIYDAKRIAKIEYHVDDVWEVFDFNMKEGFYRSAASTFQEKTFVINTNCLFGYFRGHDNDSIQIVIHKPNELYAATSLNKSNSIPDQDEFLMKDYHQLVDNPILYSVPDTITIKLPKIDVQVACYSTSGQSISGEIARFIEPLLVNQTNYLGGSLPVDKYTFLIYHNLNPDPSPYLADGLEHSHSTLILMYMPLKLDAIKKNVYGIASHEFFHTLLPLALHSQEIAHYDFNQPKFSRHLWLYEGTTEYFTIHMPVKSGIQDLNSFLHVLEGIIKEMRRYDNELPMTELSLHPIEMQDQFYNVYLRGTMINLCLDIYLRDLSHGDYGVQDLVADLIEKYGKDKPFDDTELFEEIVKTTGFPEVRDFISAYIEGSKELPLKEMLEKAGLRLEDGKISQVEDITPEQLNLRKSWINQ